MARDRAVPAYYANHYGRLEGGVIERVDFEVDPDEPGELWPVLRVALLDGRRFDVEVD